MAIRFNGHTINLNTIKKVRINGHTVYQEATEYDGLKLTSQIDGSTIAYRITGTITAIIQTSTDGSTWTAWDGTAITLNNGEFRYIRNTNSALSLSSSNYFKFIMTGSISASGNCKSMLNFADLSSYCFAYMFRGCTGLTSAPELPATTLAVACYNNMFYNCTALTSAPSLPATSLSESCYEGMFYGCTGLTSAPALPATTLPAACYNNMFYGCTQLTTAPSLPATQLSYGCYHSMFYNCTALTSAPSLPATTLADYCYNNMFYGCSNLKVNENGEGTTIFTCPETIPTSAVLGMFNSTGGSFTGTPTAGNTYKYYA